MILFFLIKSRVNLIFFIKFINIENYYNSSELIRQNIN